MNKVYYILLLFLLVRCETNPPTTPDTIIPDLGKIYVTANIDGASIFLNNVNTGKVTPDTIEAAVGTHTLRLEKTGYASISIVAEVLKDSVVNVDIMLHTAVSKVVLLEDFANVSCAPCVTSNKIIEQLVTATYGTAKLVAIKYPTSFPSPNDPFYLANKPDCDARRAYYSIVAAPTTIIDGIHRPISIDSLSVKEKIEEQLIKTPQFKVEVSDSINGNLYLAKVDITLLDAEGIDFSNLILHTVVTETDIEFATPPGSNGETKFYDVMRAMLPTNQGESLSDLQNSQMLNFERQVAINPGWNTAHLNVVAFVQNQQTKEVYQAASTF
jgi:hypothetical protein